MARMSGPRLRLAALVAGLYAIKTVVRVRLDDVDASTGRMSFLHRAIETFEYGFRHSRGHSMVQEFVNLTRIQHHAWRPWAVVYMHVPRTAGDSLRTHMFLTDNIWSRAEWQEPVSLYRDLEARGWLNWTTPSRPPIFKGFISGADLRHLREGPWAKEWRRVQRFTVLRDPVERLLSAAKYVQEYRYRNCSGSGDEPTLRNVLDPAKCLGLNRWGMERRTVEHKLRSFFHNALAFQLGDELGEHWRTKRPEEAVELAKETLRELDYVAFYEDWYLDFYGLWDKIFVEFERDQDGDGGASRTLPWRFLGMLRRLMFELNALFFRARMRTRKYAAQVVDPEDWGLIQNLTYYDQQVYDFARDLTRRPRDPFYSNYVEYMSVEGGPTLVALIVCLSACCFACCRGLRCCLGAAASRLAAAFRAAPRHLKSGAT